MYGVDEAALTRIVRKTFSDLNNRPFFARMGIKIVDVQDELIAMAVNMAKESCGVSEVHESKIGFRSVEATENCEITRYHDLRQVSRVVGHLIDPCVNELVSKLLHCEGELEKSEIRLCVDNTVSPPNVYIIDQNN